MHNAHTVNYKALSTAAYPAALQTLRLKHINLRTSLQELAVHVLLKAQKKMVCVKLEELASVPQSSCDA